MSIIGNITGSGEGTETFGEMTVEKRVLLTPSRTIFIPNISVMTVGVYRIWWPLIASLFTASAAFYTEAQKNMFDQTHSPMTFVWICATFALLFWFFVNFERRGLLIRTNDGSGSLFLSHDLKMLEDVRRVLSDKINADDETSTYTINFASGKIEGLSIGSVEKLETGAIVTGSNNMIAANSPGAKVGSTETTYSASNSPGAVVGAGNTVGTNTVAVQHIDYSSVLPTIEEWQRYYAQRTETQKLAERLSELEVLMRSGTPSPESKGRVRTLAGELSQILQGYPPAVQLFESVMRLVGG